MLSSRLNRAFSMKTLIVREFSMKTVLVMINLKCNLLWLLKWDAALIMYFVQYLHSLHTSDFLDYWTDPRLNNNVLATRHRICVFLTRANLSRIIFTEWWWMKCSVLLILWHDNFKGKRLVSSYVLLAGNLYARHYQPIAIISLNRILFK